MLRNNDGIDSVTGIFNFVIFDYIIVQVHHFQLLPRGLQAGSDHVIRFSATPDQPVGLQLDAPLDDLDVDAL